MLQFSVGKGKFIIDQLVIILLKSVWNYLVRYLVRFMLYFFNILLKLIDRPFLCTELQAVHFRGLVEFVFGRAFHLKSVFYFILLSAWRFNLILKVIPLSIRMVVRMNVRVFAVTFKNMLGLLLVEKVIRILLQSKIFVGVFEVVKLFFFNLSLLTFIEQFCVLRIYQRDKGALLELFLLFQSVLLHL